MQHKRGGPPPPNQQQNINGFNISQTSDQKSLIATKEIELEVKSEIKKYNLNFHFNGTEETKLKEILGNFKSAVVTTIAQQHVVGLCACHSQSSSNPTRLELKLKTVSWIREKLTGKNYKVEGPGSLLNKIKSVFSSAINRLTFVFSKNNNTTQRLNPSVPEQDNQQPNESEAPESEAPESEAHNESGPVDPCMCRREKGFTEGWCGVAGGGVPACDH